jgi:tetratricopeptide (TPR) repeat protein
LLNQQQPAKALLVFLCLLPSVDGAEMAKTKYQIGMLVRTLPADRFKVAVDTALGFIHEPAKRAIVHFALGDVLDRLNRSPEAIQHYQVGIKENPRFARGYLRLGEDLELVKKDFKGAMENYRKASALDKEGKDKEIPLRIKALEKKLKG